jgi:hypothetical protein
MKQSTHSPFIIFINYRSQRQRLICLILLVCILLLLFNYQLTIGKAILTSDSSQQLVVVVSPTIVVFYNIFVPDTRVGQDNSLRIVKAQLAQLALAPFLSKMQQRPAAPIILRYVTIGTPNVVTPVFMKQHCPRRYTCEHAHHVDSGTEATTLQQLHDYCSTSGDNTQTIAAYIHNKGSFHESTVNENWRPILTDAVLSSECVNHTMHDDCNVCGLQFFMVRGLLKVHWHGCFCLSLPNASLHSHYGIAMVAVLSWKHVHGEM